MLAKKPLNKRQKNDQKIHQKSSKNHLKWESGGGLGGFSY